MARICVFCASAPGLRPSYAEGARALAGAIVAGGHSLVYGGGNVGLMGVVADAVLAAGGEVVGVIPHTLMAREIGHTGVTRLHVVDSMHERKALMADLSDAFVALPGGVGTFEELFEAITWTQLGLHRKPCGLLNVDGFYDGLLRFLDHAWAEGFIKPETRAIVSAGTDARELLQRLLTTPMPAVPQWISPRER
ncbi:MAG: TIGR00730 family Rossman fold protein [Acidobacteria bacterium]|nr:TIGR00730 family Rossman fold protein [Acidobacteriota bacterium]